MIKVKIREWDPLSGSLGTIISSTTEGTLELLKNLKHTSTIWMLATDRGFANVIYTRTDEVHLNFFQYDITVPVGTSYWLKAVRVLNFGAQKVESLPIEITADDNIRNNIIRDYDLFIDTPTIRVKSEDIELEEKFTIATSKFRSNGDYHTYTHWVLMDGNNEVLWCKLFDTENLTSIIVDNANQPYATKNKLVLKVIHGSSSGVESKAGHYAINYNHTNFEIMTSLANVTPFKELIISFKLIDPEYGIGISAVIVEENSDSTYKIKKTLYLDENYRVTIPWFYLGYDKTLKLTIECTDKNGNIFNLVKKLTTSKYEATQIIDSNKTYKKIVFDYIEHDEEEDSKLYIPNYFYSEPLHNNLIPLPAKGDSVKFYGYELDGMKLKFVKELKGLEVRGDKTKEGMLIKRISNDYVMISHNPFENGMNLHEILIFKYSVATDSYYLAKTLRPVDEKYGLGYTNSAVQVNNEKLYYIPTNTDKLKRLDLQTYSTATITEDIPHIINNKVNRMYLTPTVTNMPDGRLWILGGYGSLTATYDYFNNNFQESIYWEYGSYIGNRLKAVPLHNGDALIVRTENLERPLDDVQEEIEEEENDNFVLDLTAKEEWALVNRDTNMKETVFRLKEPIDEIDLPIGEKFVIEFTSNLTSLDPKQIFVSYNKNVFSLEKISTKQIEFRCYNNIKYKKYQFLIGASKAQQFNQATGKGELPYTHTVSTIDYFVNVKRSTDIDNLPDDENSKGYFEPNTNSAEQEKIILLGNKYGYQSGEVTFNLYKDAEVNIPFETVNCLIDDLAWDLDPDLAHAMDITITKLNANLGLISINNIINYKSEYITIYNKLRQATFFTFRFSWVEHATGNTPEKPTLIRNDNELNLYSTISYVDLARYVLDIPTRFTKAKLISNRPDMLEISNRTTVNGFSASFRKRGVTVLYLTDDMHPEGIYCNSYYIVNNANIVPDLDIAIPDISIKRDSTRTGLLRNDWTGFNIGNKNSLEVTISQDALSKSLLDISLDMNTLTINSKNQLGDTSFKIITKNLDDNTIKTVTYQVHIVKEENYTVDLDMTFEDSLPKQPEETLYFTPNSYNYFNYTQNGGTPLLNIPDSIYIDKDASLESMNDVNPYIKMVEDKDLGKEVIQFVFRNRDNANLLVIKKNILLVPIVWYVEDDFMGKIPLHQYKFICQKGEVNEYTLSYKLTPGYRPTSTRLTSDVEYLDGIRYSIRKNNNDETKYKLRIETPKTESLENVSYKFYLGYTYISDTVNPIMALDKDWLQSFTVTSVGYKQEVYIKVNNDNLQINKNQTTLLDIETNGKHIKLISGNTSILKVDNETREVTGLKEGKASVIIQAGGYDQIVEQTEAYFEVLPEIPEEEKPQGLLLTNPEHIRVIEGNRANVAIKTNADYWTARTDNPRIATFDDITSQVIGLRPGETNLAITYRGEKIQGSTKRVPIQVLATPKQDPGCLYYDKQNHTLLPTNCDFIEHHPTATLVCPDGRVVLSCYKKITRNIGTITNPNMKEFWKTFYCIFE